MPSIHELNLRHAQKVAAIAAGKCTTYPAGPKSEGGTLDLSTVEGRYQAKLVARNAPKPAESDKGGKPEAKPAKGKGSDEGKPAESDKSGKPGR